MADCDDAGIVLSVLALALEPGADGQAAPPPQPTRIRNADRDRRIERHLGELAVGAMRWITYLERGDKNAPFRVPQSLRESVIGRRSPWSQ